MARRVLVIAYYFPPLGMGGVQRMAKLAKYLPEFGYDVTVLTVKDIRYPAYDKSLLDDLPDSVEIIRSGSCDPARLARFLPFSFRPGKKLSLAAKNKGGLWPDSKIGWKKSALKTARRLIEAQPPDMIISSSPPITAHLVAMELKEQYGLPWVADFRDIWESRPPEDLYREQKLIDKSNDLLKNIADNADAVTTVNTTIATRLNSKARVIMGGYDVDDMGDIAADREDSKFVFCYLGTVGPLQPMEPFFEAVRQASAADLEFAARASFRIIGVNDPEWIMQAAARFGLDKQVELIGYLPHREALAQASSASVSILSVPAGYSEISTGKIFDLLALPMPILASVPTQGEAEKLICKYRAGLCVEPDSPPLLAEAMLKLFRDFREGRIWEKEDISGFTRREAASAFARLMDEVLND
ncbi:MAG: glycosyltransferase family 4 protein [FCB group bacterium]|nr:glycosyltransferase family 4 protein [FCB group bacterium]